MKTSSNPDETTASDPPVTLADLIDSGYSEHFAIQLKLSQDLAEPIFYSFDDEDRRNWGQRVLIYDRKIELGPRVLPVDGYASHWINESFRLICLPPQLPPQI
jgi:hypothetical protein